MRTSRSIAGRSCATPAPTRRSRFALASPLAMRRAFEKAHKGRFGFVDRAKAIVIEAVLGGGGRRRGARFRARRSDAVLTAPSTDGRPFGLPMDRVPRSASAATSGQRPGSNLPGRRNSSPRAPGARRTSICARRCRSARRSTARRSSSSRTRRSSSSRAGAPRSRRRTMSCSSGSNLCRSARRSAPRPIPVMLEIFNHLFMSIAEQMGVTLQNTAYSVNIKERLDFSCAVFDRRRPPRRQRAAHAGASRLDGPLGRDDHPRECGPHPPGRRVRPQRPLQRRHPSARRHRLHAGVRRGRRRRSCSGPPRAAITPTSAGSRRAR